MRFSTPLLLVAAMIGVVILYFGGSALFRPGASETVGTPEPARFTVLAARIEPRPWSGAIVIRGRTEADQKVIVRADVSGVVIATPVAQGSPVKTGQVLCRIEIEARGADVRETQAALKKAEIDYKAAVRLAEEGFRSETGVAAIKAAYDQARANAERAGVQFGKTEIRAPFDGVLDARMADVGDLLKPGDPCGVVIKPTPFLVKGSIAEKDVSRISVGDKGVARLATGEEIEGVVRFVATSADPATRTFNVELVVPNEDGALRDGVTADFTVFADEREAHSAPRSALTLDAEGRVGVKLVGEGKRVRFHAVAIAGEDDDGVWLTGLDGPVMLIVRGQDFVADGQIVDVTEQAGAS